MKVANKLFQRIGRKFWGAFGIPAPYFGLALTGSQIFGGDEQAGRLYTADPSGHSVVFSCIRLIADKMSEQKFAVTATFGQYKDEPSADHNGAMVLNRPVGISKPELMYAIVEGLIANGNAYLIPENNKRVRLVDWRNMKPPTRGAMYYEEKDPVKQVIRRYNLDEVIHLKYKLSPTGLTGTGPLVGSVLNDIIMDVQASQYTTTMLRNLGVPGIIATPELPDAGDFIDPDVADDVREKLDEQFSGAGKGRGFALRAPWKFFEPKGAMGRVDLRELRWVPEERICAAIGVPPAIISVGTGTEQTKVGATMDVLHEVLLLDCILPLADKIVAQLTEQLLPLFVNDRRYSLILDFSEDPAMQALQRRVLKEELEMAVAGYQAGIIGLEEARLIAHYTEPAPDDIYEEPALSQNQSTNPNDNAA